MGTGRGAWVRFRALHNSTELPDCIVSTAVNCSSVGYPRSDGRQAGFVCPTCRRGLDLDRGVMRKITSRLGTLAILAGMLVAPASARADAVPTLVSEPSNGAASE